MPKSGFKSITITRNLYDTLEKHFQDNRQYYQSQGINTFAGFIQKRLNQHIQEKQNLRNIASRIDRVPDIFTETKRVVKT